MILTGPEIERQISEGEIEVDPFNPEHVGPASLDLTLGGSISSYVHLGGGGAIDSRDPQHRLREILYAPGDKVLLEPGMCYLMHTAERISVGRYIAVLDGKSSFGRMFLCIHQTAGYVDPGWDGKLTMEVTARFPVWVYIGMRIAQIRFHVPQGDYLSYQQTGKYIGKHSSRESGPLQDRSQ